MRWKSWILAGLVFVGTCLLADRVFTRWVILRSPFPDAGRIQHLYQENDGEIPIFGTSKAHGHYCPSDMGLNAFNYGLDLASFRVTDVLLQIELAKPKTTPVIIELQFTDTGQLGDESVFIPFVSDARIRQLLEKFHAMEWRYHLPAIRYFGHYDVYFKDYINEHLHVAKASQGFRELVHPPPFDQARLDQFVQQRLQETTGYFPDEEENRRLIALITAHPQRLFFLVLSPNHPSYFAHFQNADRLKVFEEKLAVIPNVVLIDHSREPFPDDDFLDTVHLRREGTAKFSQEMGEQIRQVLRARSEPAAPGPSGPD